MPGDFLKRSINSVDARAQEMDHSMGSEWKGVWVAMSDPSQMDEKAYKEIIDWKKSQEEWLQDMHDRGCPRVQEVIKKFSKAEFGELTLSFSNMVRYYSPDRKFPTTDSRRRN